VFQAEDGIRYATVTGVQTCALPILTGNHVAPASRVRNRPPHALASWARLSPRTQATSSRRIRTPSGARVAGAGMRGMRRLELAGPASSRPSFQSPTLG